MNWKTRRAVALLVLAVLLLTLCGMPSSALAEGALLLSPDSQTFIRSISERVPQASEMVPDPISLSHARGQAVFPEAAYPASYDLRTQGKLTPVKDQNPYGTCWAFASLASLESGLMPGDPWDFSENHLVRWSGFDNAPEGPYNHSGNASMAAAYLARWQGPVNEADSPYIDPTTPSVLPVQKHVQEVLFLPPRASKLDNDNIKGALTTYGAVVTLIYWDDPYFSDATDAYYYDGGSDTNHGVAIVGWDDNYDKSRFTGTSGSPPGNGAFIVRNSWGSIWGESGYFYLSYYDNVVGWFRVFNGAEAVTNFGRNYQYDPLGWVGDGGYGTNTAWFANVFTAQAGESLVAVGFYTTAVNATYEVYMKPNFSGSSFVGPLAKSGSFATPGYHTVGFASPISVTAGSQFCVAVKMTTPAYGFPIPIEVAVAGYSSGAASGPGQSYISQSGSSWADITTVPAFQTANVCLKAFTAAATPVPTIGYSPSSLTFHATQGGPNPPAQTLSIWNAGTGILNWNTGESAAWLSLNPTSGSSTGETDPISAVVDIIGLPAGTYTATITLSATGASNTPRQVPVTLVVDPSGPGIGYSPGSFTFSCTRNQANPPPGILEVWNAGGGTLNWTAAEGVAWLSLAPTSGSSTGEHDSTTLSVDAAGLATGTYTATVTLAAVGANNSPQSVGVTLTLREPLPSTADLWLEPAACTVGSPQQDLQLTCQVGSITNINTISFSLLWDPAKLALNTTAPGSSNGVELGTLFAGLPGNLQVAPSSGRVDIAAGVQAGTVNGPGQVVKLHFNVLGGLTQGTTIPLTFSATPPATILRGDGSELQPQTAGSLLTVAGYLVWPGDTNADGAVNVIDYGRINLYWNKSGPSRPNGSMQWLGQSCPPGWTPTAAMHADCNGNGVINVADYGGVNLNWGKSHPLSTLSPALSNERGRPSFAVPPGAEGEAVGSGPSQLWLEPAAATVGSPQQELSLSLKVGSTSSINTASFSLLWDPTKLALHTTFPGSSNGVELGSLFTGKPGNLQVTLSSGRVDIAAGVQGGTLDGPGEVARIHFSVLSGLPGGSTIPLTFSTTPPATLLLGDGSEVQPQCTGSLLTVQSSHALSYSLSAGWNMISLPVVPASTNPSVVFNGLPLGWVMYAWDAANGRYIGKEQIVLGLTGGYWLKVSNAVEYSVSGQPNEAAQTGIDLGMGWNLIGVPYQGAIPWGAVRVSRDGGALVTLDQAIGSNWIQAMFFRWQGSAYQGLTTGGIFQPLSGYWVKTKTAGVRLVFTKP